MSAERGHRISSIGDAAQVEQHDMNAYLVYSANSIRYILRGGRYVWHNIYGEQA